MNDRLGRGLYGILDLPPVSSVADVAAVLTRARFIYEPLYAAQVAFLQLRMKGAEARVLLEVFAALKAGRPAGSRTRLIMNDRLDVALVAGADGVHLGQDDLPLPAARRIVKECAPSGFLIGISTHNEAQAETALAGEPDYLALGPIYETTSKKNPDPVVGVARLAALAQRTNRPLVAIGGITLSRVSEIAAAGADFAAIISAVNAASDISAAAAAVQSHFAATSAL